MSTHLVKRNLKSQQEFFRTRLKSGNGCFYLYPAWYPGTYKISIVWDRTNLEVS